MGPRGQGGNLCVYIALIVHRFLLKHSLSYSVAYLLVSITILMKTLMRVVCRSHDILSRGGSRNVLSTLAERFSPALIL